VESTLYDRCVPGRIVVLCPHPPDRAPGQRLKFEQYYDSWRAAGHEVVVRPFWSDAAWQVLYQRGHVVRKVAGVLGGLLRRLRDVREARRADLVYLFLEVAPVGPPIFERWIRRSRVPTVYDIDDLVYLPHHSAANRFMRWLRSHGKVPESIAAADHVIVCTEHLERYARQFSDRVTDISSTIDTDAYQPRRHDDRTRGVVIGWSGSHSTAPYLHLLDDVLRELARTDGITVKVIGDAGFAIDGVDVDAQAWRLESEVADLSMIDIGVYPLPDEEWVLGKSGLKALQYMALGIPTVAQRIGSNIEIIEEGVNGFLADAPDEWVAILRRLVNDPQLRRSIGERARQTVVDRYSVAVTAPVYLRILDEAMARPR
jgi:glycosyltransferase involved in cell wall biosynthesis